ncbi:M23 family metallopeptidase [Candidatus Collierbacteria bacterium]|nr:M23 family metallopeptidase [Candidatus Collierbacteria bacterium]
MPVLEPPVDLARFPVTHGFWIDETDNPLYREFYGAFAGHHPGVDFALPEGTPVKAATPGIVVRREIHQGMGKTIAIRLGSVYSLYSHLSEFCIELGQLLRPKQLIAYSGNTGQATTAPHLHFELRDLTKIPLKDSVFEPVFGQEIKNFQPTFNYVINNTNTQKTFTNLAVRYFGLPSYASLIRDSNPNLKDLSFDSPLPGGQTIIIPNYPDRNI